MTFAIGRRATLGLIAAGAAVPAARAQTVPRPARVIVGFPPGGSSDVVARLYAERLRGLYAPTLVVDGRVGAAGRIAVEFVKGADPDGLTYLQTPASMLTLQPHVFPREVRYDALTDLIPVSTVCSYPFAFAVPKDHPAQTLPAWIDWAKAQRAELPWASPAAGSAPHFIGIMLAKKAGLNMTHVPFRGAAPAVQDLIAGRLTCFIGVLGDVSPHQGQGLRLLAVSSPARNPRFPEVPTFAELGHPDLNKDEWFGALLPANTPAPIVEGLHRAIRAAAATPEMIAALDRLEYMPTTSDSPAAFAARIRQEREDWGAVVRESGFRPEN
ncbi:twin-arginine translocation pathway signal protein [Roseomonas sp. JC162]|uniref:Twin-arginine translocation pathway signal protein n=1 Tax=Neoroseomonas marina TaxID=1232220 RepID=A0A848E959_9PROT|nr:tripartite tricarboxylate transporter substrate-binding protein [Neoroseomonas marina]NMJ40107.1 twin-arginine translocation pathway signal protein [Neoroseomonas marina]